MAELARIQISSLGPVWFQPCHTATIYPLNSTKWENDSSSWVLFTICKTVLIFLYGYAKDKSGGELLCVDGKNHNKMQSLRTYTFCKAYAMICFTQRNLCKQNTANRDMKVALASNNRYMSCVMHWIMNLDHGNLLW